MAAATKSKSSKKPARKSPAVKEAEQIHKMRDEHTNPPVDTPVDVTESVGETEPVDGKTVTLTAEGSSATLQVGSCKAVLDREGVLSLQRHLNRVAAGF